MLSLSTSDDLSNLAVGQTATIDVILSGLSLDVNDPDAYPAGLTSLGATVEWEGSLLGIPSISYQTSPNGVIPAHADLDPLDPAVLALEDPGLADFIYDSLYTVNGDFITSNGIFYSFDVTAQSAGAGSFAVAFAGASSVNDNGDEIFIDPELGPTLAYHVLSPSGVIPEPSSFLVWGALLVVGFVVRRRLRR